MKIREAFITYKDTGRTMPRKELTCARTVRRYMADVAHTLQEQFWVILLDAKLAPIARSCVFVGTLDSVMIHPREVLRLALLAAAHSIIVVHNHPSGDPQPSRQDMEVTAQLKEAGDVVGIPLLDHIIIGDAESDEKGIGYSSWNDGW
jgi:DNA repair protein RadC